MAVGTWDRSIPYAEMAARETELADVIVPALEAATPGSGTCLNGASFHHNN